MMISPLGAGRSTPSSNSLRGGVLTFGSDGTCGRRLRGPRSSTMRGICPAVLALLALLSAGWSDGVRAQVVRGVVVSEDASETLEGVLVLAADSTGQTHATRITGPDGAFYFALPHSGRWTLRAERLGYGTGEQPVALSVGDTVQLTMVVAPAPIAIRGVEAEVGRRCPETSSAPQVLSIWTEAREILASVVRQEDRATARFKSRVRHRDYSRYLVVPETIVWGVDDTLWTQGSVPMRAADPEFLMNRGFVVLTEADTMYYSPDARVILSDEFLSSHCFFLAEDAPSPDWTGLAFGPVMDSPIEYDIRGTFWLPRTTEVLPYIDFEFTAHPWDLVIPVNQHDGDSPFVRAPIEFPTTGGRVDLSFVPELGWVVHRWLMRWPIPGVERYGRRLLLFTREWIVELLQVARAR